MKKILAIVLLTASLALSARAVIITGFEAGYLTDSKDSYLAARLGVELKSATSVSHQLEAELGYSRGSDSIAGPGPTPISATTKIMPLTLNYRAEFAGANKLGYYLGFGAGVSRNRISFAGSGVPLVSDSDTALALQGFAGINYKATPATSLQLGLKYIWIGEAELLGVKADVGDDLAIMAGISFKF